MWINIVKVLFLVSCSLLLTPHKAYSQTTEVGIWSGFGTNNLNSLRIIPAQTLNGKTISKLSTTDSYPINYGIGIELNTAYQIYTFGVFFRYEKSGTQKAYYDLTQELYYDQEGTNLVFGISGKYILWKQQHSNLKLYPYFSFKTGTSFSELSYREKQENLNTNIVDAFDINSQIFFAEPGFGFKTNKGSFMIEPNVSFFIPLIQSDYKINGNHKLDNTSEENNSDTSFLGLRAGITLGIKI